jgi:protein O-mannosyl-transferase
LKTLSFRESGPTWPWALAILAVLICAAYLPSFASSFQFDDWNVIVFEKRVQSLLAWWHSMPGIRPLTKFSYALNHEFRADVSAFRLTNVLIHLATALAAFVLFAKLLQRSGWSKAQSSWAALGIALIFALHPAQTEAVTYISGRSGSLCGMFALWSLAVWLPALSANPRWWRSAASAVLFALALLAKETALVLPLALLLMVLLREGQHATWRVEFRHTALHWVIAAVALGLIVTWPPYRRLIMTSLDIRSMSENLLTQANAVGYLVGQLLRWDRLNADPRLPIIATASLLSLSKVAAVVGVLLGSLWLSMKRHYWAFGVLWFLLWLAPTNSLLARLEVANDRQLYLPLLGAAWILIFPLRALWLRPLATMQRVKAGHWLVSVFGAAVLAAMLLGTVTRNQVYATEAGYWQDVLAKTPSNARAANNLGYVLLLQCRLPEARVLLERALQLDPDYTKAGVNLRLLREGVTPVSGKDCPRQ